MRLTDVYYTDQTLDGNPEPPAKELAPEFYQGEDAIFDIFLNFAGNPVLTEDWDITAIIKKNQYALNTLFEATIDEGLYKLDVPGFYRILLPADATATFLAGT